MTTSSKNRRLVFVSPHRKALESVPDSVVCGARQDCVDLLGESSRWLWVALNNSLLMEAIEEWLPQRTSGDVLGDLLLLKSPAPSHLPVLRTLFDRVAGDEPTYRLLPLDEIVTVLSEPHDVSMDLFIGGAVDQQIGALVLVRGNLERLVVPLSMFKPVGGTKPDPKRLEFTDFGQTVKLGQYEAASDAILYEWDPDYRRKTNGYSRATAAMSLCCFATCAALPRFPNRRSRRRL